MVLSGRVTKPLLILRRVRKNETDAGHLNAKTILSVNCLKIAVLTRNHRLLNAVLEEVAVAPHADPHRSEEAVQNGSVKYE